METDAIAGVESGMAILKKTVKISAPSIVAASMISSGMFSMNPLIIKVEKGMTHAV